MDKLAFVLGILLIVGATNSNGADLSGQSEFPPKLVPLTPPDILIEPIFEEHSVLPKQINGRLLTPADECGYSPMGAPRIIGGGPAKIGGYPWIALIGYKTKTGNFGGFLCGGSLITSNFVLSAAHCSGDMWFARLGEHDVRHTHDGKHEDFEIVEEIIHPDYHYGLLLNDIMLMRLKDHVPFTRRMRPICLPNDAMQGYNSNYVNATPFVAGWGKTVEKGPSSSFLKHVQVPVVDLNTCRKIFHATPGALRPDTQITEQVLCAGTQEGQSSCNGDSGGPLMLPLHSGNGKFPFYQIGLVSWSVGCARIPTVYSNTQYYRGWIQSVIDKYQ